MRYQWVSGFGNFILLDTETRNKLQNVPDSLKQGYGIHTTVNRIIGDELIYIDENFKINIIKIISHVFSTSNILINITDLAWKPQSVHWVPSSGDLLVGMYRWDMHTGKTRCCH